LLRCPYELVAYRVFRFSRRALYFIQAPA
jgi:hypothetical protein